MKLLVLGIIIGANNLAAALALGALGRAVRWQRILIVFAVFEFSVPLIGIWIGREAAVHLGETFAWVGPVLVGIIGLWTILAGLLDKYDLEHLAKRATSWTGLSILSAGLSIDNLAIGFSLGLKGYAPLMLAATIAACSVLFAAIGLSVGRLGRRSLETPAEVLAGVLLLILAAANATGWI